MDGIAMKTDTRHVRIGSRGSDLALWQARWVASALREKLPTLEISVEIIRTMGDNVLDSPLSAIGDKGLFTKEIEQALLEERIDLAVHSLKDLPTELPDGLILGAVTRREDVRDVFIPHPSNICRTLLGQPEGSSIATGSLRRRCQLLHLRPDFEIIDVRGNLNTRLRKLEESTWAGMILARAGVVRLGWERAVGETIPAETILPAVGQGALGIEIRARDRRVTGLVAGLTHVPTEQATMAERALLRRMEGGCQVPLGAYGRMDMSGEQVPSLQLDAMVGSLDGKTVVRGKIHGDPVDADKLGRHLADTLLAGGAARLLESIRKGMVPHEPV
jgi:porphobilinogen deaminase